MPFELKQEKKKTKPRYFKAFFVKIFRTYLFRSRRTGTAFYSEKGLIEVIALTVVGRVNVNFCIN